MSTGQQPSTETCKSPPFPLPRRPPLLPRHLNLLRLLRLFRATVVVYSLAPTRPPLIPCRHECNARPWAVCCLCLRAAGSGISGHNNSCDLQCPASSHPSHAPGQCLRQGGSQSRVCRHHHLRRFRQRQQRNEATGTWSAPPPRPPCQRRLLLETWTGLPRFPLSLFLPCARRRYPRLPPFAALP